ncbi:MerR family transcriptional regulator [Phreatobacter stygius]|uniref:MerR family transcriptional regulator n=1 Tax=Phreatobacter stygius TaxID=1940610 RepID=A0A4D7AZ75_9HYPH|nr:helix-turn-helix domain-containing protein [Phreatobacter stygius]QCI66764.1 MerR family transcriptional regulator [Phreatobacter stygius]
MTEKIRTAGLTIGVLARRAATKVPTIRYYETIGLMPEPFRSEGNQRLYDPRHASRLLFIRHARELGFPIDAIRSLLDLADQPERPCEDADRLASEQLEAVRRRIVRLRALESELQRMIESCRRGRAAECRVIETLGNHDLCADDHPGDGESPITR